jgi:amino acid adenylation domain-containing protein
MSGEQVSIPGFEHTLPGRFLHGLALSPRKDAIRVSGQSVTYERMHDLALTWAGSLLRACDEPPSAVAVLAGKGAESYIGVLTALYCGAAAVPLQPDFPVGRTRHMLTAAKVSALVTDAQGARLIPGLPEADGMPILVAPTHPGAYAGATGAASAVTASAVTGVDAARGVPVLPGAALDQPRRADPADVAYILFTSGSTGRPKGVLITHANLDYYFTELQSRYDFGPDDVFSQVFDPAFDCAISDLFAAWGAGGTLVSVPAQAYRGMTGFVTEAGITIWYSTPAAISVVSRRGGLAAKSMPTLRLSTFAGDALKAADAAAWQAAAPGSVVDNLYGPAETTITCTVYRWSQDSSPAECVNGIVPIGRLHSGHEYLLLDPDGGESPTEGELWLSGPQVTPGYLDPADDRDRFLVRRSRRWYRTGDRMRRAGNGDLLFLGRTDNQVQVQGWRTELAEIDHQVRRCRGIQDAVTVATTVDDKVQLVVFYTGTPTTSADFAKQLLKTLPQQMLPRHYRHLEEIPLSLTRKVDRQALRRRALELFRHDEPAESHEPARSQEAAQSQKAGVDR